MIKFKIILNFVGGKNIYVKKMYKTNSYILKIH